VRDDHGVDASTRDVTAALGPAAAVPDGDAGRLDGGPDLVLDLGPRHPSTHGGLRLRLRLDGDRIVHCDPEVGFLHRGAEKLFEARDYRQVVMLVNRHDWLSAFANELGVVIAVERMLGIEVPPRAVWLRTALAELNRVLHHLLFLGTYPPEIGEAPRWALTERETLLGLMEELTGGRMHFMFNRVGGLKEELPAGWVEQVTAALARLRTQVPALRDALAEPLFEQRTRGVGVLSHRDALEHGVSGPVARASGLDVDLRRDEPYLGYDELEVVVPTSPDGDAWSRFSVLVEEVAVSLDLVDAALQRLRALPPGPVNVRLPKIVKAPEGSTYAWTESPGGINGYYLVSHGEKTPWRLKLRSPGFNNASALPALLHGARVADLVPVLGSLFFVVGDIDK
jgi:NADH-quinone oxidoreductase subunit D